jgi:kynureninase
MTTLREKSRLLTGYLEALLRERCGNQLQQLTGGDPEARGAQLSLRVGGGRERARQVFEALRPQGLIADWREPDVIRLAPVPLYNSFDEVWRAVDILSASLAAQP